MKTIKQIADEIGVTKAALQKRISRGSLYTRLSPYISVVNGTKYIDTTGENIIKEAFESKPFVKPVDMTGIWTGIDGNMDGNTCVPMSDSDNSLIEILREQQADLRKQLEIKDKQLEVKDKQIEELNARLQEVTTALINSQQTTNAEQILHAGTQTKLLTDGNEKTSFWSKIFKKKNGQD